MIQVLQFIFSDLWHFIGALLILWSICWALAHFTPIYVHWDIKR